MKIIAFILEALVILTIVCVLIIGVAMSLGYDPYAVDVPEVQEEKQVFNQVKIKRL